MIAPKLFAATFAIGMSSGAMAGSTISLGVPSTTLGQLLGVVTLPILEGGILTVAVVALVAGIRIVQRKKQRNG